MGYGSAENAEGRKVGYLVPTTCEHEGCDKQIDCGMAYACGGDHDDCGGQACAGYFCDEHMYAVDHEAMGYTEINGSLCEKCWRNAREDIADKVLAGDLNVIDPYMEVAVVHGSFSWALIQMKAGKKVRSGEWGGRRIAFIKGSCMYECRIGDTSEHDWRDLMLDSEALLATDWTLYEGEQA